MTHEGDARFASILAECCDRARSGESVPAILSTQLPEYRAELARLVPLAARISALSIDPAAEFRADLMRQLETATAPQRPAVRFSPAALTVWLKATPLPRAAAAVLVVAAALGGADAVAASESTLPDNPLYQVKVTREWMEVSLAPDPGARAAVHLRQVALRERELEAAIRNRRGSRVVDAVAGRLSATTERMIAEALEARGRGNESAARQANLALRGLDTRLAILSGQTRQPLRPILTSLRLELAAKRARLSPGQ